MPTWPGGACPECGEYMPENLIHCQRCRALLNADLEPDSVEIPEFIPLQEIASMIDVQPAGYYVNCPVCERELRVRSKYAGTHVQCKFCSGRFPLDLTSKAKPHAFFAECPECKNELRANVKYLGQKVACKHCSARIHFVEAAD